MQRLRIMGYVLSEIVSSDGTMKPPLAFSTGTAPKIFVFQDSSGIQSKQIALILQGFNRDFVFFVRRVSHG
eukprot:scaffold5885_cov201-Amphora_coffeaeformis.AAC.16